MYISRFQLHNHKSFYEPPALKFESGFNIITGQNNAGKTALLNALNLEGTLEPHRSLKTIPTPGAQPAQISWLDISFDITKDELQKKMDFPGTKIYIPYPHTDEGIYRSFGFNTQHPHFNELFKYVFSRENLTFKVRLFKEGNNQQWIISEYPSFGIYKGSEAAPSTQRLYAIREKTLAGEVEYRGNSQRAEELGVDLANNFLVPRIYLFSAERFNMGICRFGDNPILAPNATNLPEVLDNLQGNNPSRFKEFNSLVNKILRQIQWVSVVPIANGEVKILIWTIDPNSQRADLAVPLTESGTGIGQVLAILYVVLNSDHSRIILIDEPQSFLHPGAVRKLIEVLKAYPQHQYIIATHSPTVITSANPSTITMVSINKDGESNFTPINANDSQSLQTYLAEIGARLADVFGADEILWVEGLTEERCFPRILEEMTDRSLMGTQILGLSRTGDFEGRHAELVLEIYKRLSGDSNLLPPAIGFIFDRECKTQKKMEELNARSGGKIKFTSRRMYENYLLNPKAIVNVVNEIEGFRDTPVTQEEVKQLIESKQKEKSFYYPQALPKKTDRWIEEIDGAKVLEKLFSELSETRVAFNKVEHSVALTDWILEHSPENLSEIADLLKSALPSPPTAP